MTAAGKEQLRVQFRRYLQVNGCTWTSQRDIVLDALFRHDDHFDVEELVLEVRSSRSPVSRATVYRTISHLEKAGFIRKMDFEKGRALYEFIPGTPHHEHISCERCGQIIEFSNQQLEREISRVAEEKGFEMTRHLVQIYGICSECRNTEDGKTYER